ncbi:hypothetical protein GCM10010099_23750 [Streptomyces cinereus]|nr:hypothetical protein GCM10010099_23750 [Streptomyces cinereus]
MPPADGLRCRECKRPLRRPTATGLGPVCERRRNARPAPTPAARTPTAATVPPMPGQLPLEFLSVGGPVLYSDWIPGDRLHDRPVRTVIATGDLL